MNSITFTATPRTDTGKKAAKAIRKEGKIPCVMYGKDTNIHFSTTPKAVKEMIYTPDFKIADIDVDGTQHRCIVKDIQFHPVNEQIIHIDFLKLEENHPVKLEVPVRFKGVSPGVKTGGKLQQMLRRVKIKTTIDKLIDELFVDISTLQLGQSARVKDLLVSEGIEVMNSPNIPIVTVVTPRALKSASAKAAATAGPAGEEEEEETEE